MNKTIYYRYISLLALVSAAMLSTGCMPEELDCVNQKPSVDGIVFYVGHENNVDTKTALASGGLGVNFQSGDAISVFDGSNNVQFTTSTTGATATFEKGSGPDPAESQDYYAHYPYRASGVSLSGGKIVTSIPSEQSAPNGSFDPNANISVAKAEKIGIKDINGQKHVLYSLIFHNVGNLVKFHFTEDSNVSAIVIKCNANQNLTGTIKADPTTGIYSDGITNGSTTITLKPAGSQFFLQGDYYAVMLPQVHAQGISVKMEHEEGSYHFKRGDVNNLEMKRNKIYQLYSGDITSYTEAAVLPSLYMHNGTPHNGYTYVNLTGVTRISFHAMAQDVDWNFADANNVLTVMGTSDVRGYLEGGNSGTLHIYTKKGMFAIPENDVQAGTSDGTQMFNNYQSVAAIDNLSYIDVTFLHSFKNMFYNCNNLRNIDISGWDTSSADNMNGMFRTSPSSPLHDIVLGEYFVLNNPGENMFGLNSSERSNKIRVSCPESVYQQFANFVGYASGDELYNKQVTWNHGASATKFGEFLNPTIVATSVDKETNFTFTIGGNMDSSEIGDITVGFDGYTPTSPQFNQIGNETIDGVEYVMYTLRLTPKQKDDRRLITTVIAQSTEKNPTHVIMQAVNFTTVKFESRIYPYAFSGHVEVAPDAGDDANPNFISGLTANDWKDYSGHNWPIAGQSCNVTFYLKVDNGMAVNEVKLSNGTRAYACTESGSGAPAGFTAYTASNVLVSNTSGVKELKVLVQVEGQRMLHEAGVVPVKVYNLELGSALTTVPTSFDTGAVYIIKSLTSNRYLYTYTNSNTSPIYLKGEITNYSFWKFSNGNPSGCTLTTFNTATERKMYINNKNTTTNGSSASSYKVSDGLKFKYDKYYIRDNNNTQSGGYGTIGCSSTSDTNNLWEVIPVTFTAPAEP